MKFVLSWLKFWLPPCVWIVCGRVEFWGERREHFSFCSVFFLLPKSEREEESSGDDPGTSAANSFSFLPLPRSRSSEQFSSFPSFVPLLHRERLSQGSLLQKFLSLFVRSLRPRVNQGPFCKFFLLHRGLREGANEGCFFFSVPWAPEDLSAVFSVCWELVRRARERIFLSVRWSSRDSSAIFFEPFSFFRCCFSPLPGQKGMNHDV